MTKNPHPVLPRPAINKVWGWRIPDGAGHGEGHLGPAQPRPVAMPKLNRCYRYLTLGDSVSFALFPVHALYHNHYDRQESEIVLAYFPPCFFPSSLYLVNFLESS